MANLGDLSSIFGNGSGESYFNEGDFFGDDNAKSVWDGDWLDVSPVDYNREQTLPDNVKKLNNRPQLVDQWDYSHLVEKFDPNLTYLKPHSIEATKPNPKQSGFDVYATVMKIANDLRKQLTLTNDLNQVKHYLENSYTDTELKVAAPTIKSIVNNEHGLIGNVYIDPEVFISNRYQVPDSCTAGAKALKNKTAAFVKKMSSCHDCVFNKQGFCAKFNKPLQEDLVLTEKQASEYKNWLVSSKRLSPEEANNLFEQNEPSVALKVAFTYNRPESVKVGGTKAYPTVKNLSYEEAREELNQIKKRANDQKALDAVNNYITEIKPLWSYTAKAIQNGAHNNRLASNLLRQFDPSYVQKHSNVVRKLKDDQGALGKIYISSEPWDWNCKQASKEIEHPDAKSAPFVQVTPKCGSCVFQNNGHCDLFKKTIISSLKDVNIKKAYPDFIQHLHNRGRLSNRQCDYYLNETPNLKNLKQAFLVGKEVTTKVGGVKADVMPLRRPKSYVYKPKTPVANFARKLMHQGKTASAIKQQIENKFDPKEIQKENLTDTFGEFGLLGNVYIDPDVYDKCKVGAEQFNKKASIPFVKAASKCHDCVFNRNGFCGVYNREIKGLTDASTKTASTIDWKPLADQHYKILLQNGKLSKSQVINLRSVPDQKYALKLSYTLPKETNRDYSGHNERQHISDNRKDDSSIRVANLNNFVLEKMNNGYYGDSLVEEIKKNFDSETIKLATENLKTILQEEALLGNVYVNSAFNKGDCKKTASYIRQKPTVDYVQKFASCTDCRFNKQGKYCALIKKPLVSEVPYTSELAQKHLAHLVAEGRLDNTFKTASSDPKTIIKNAYKYKKPKSVRTAGLAHNGLSGESKPKLNMQKLASAIQKDLVQGVNLNSIYRKYGKYVPEFKIQEIVRSSIQQNAVPVKIVSSKQQAPVDNSVEEYNLSSDLDFDVGDSNPQQLEINDYLD